MKITHQKFPNHNLANEEERGDNLGIDFVISSILAVAVLYALYLIVPSESLSFENYFIVFAIYLGVRFLYYLGFESIYGRTPGKYQTLTKVVDKDGNKPTFIQLIIRNISRFISILSGITDEERALHDQVSNTYVVQDSNLKWIGTKKTLALLLNLLIGAFWMYYLTEKSQTSTLEFGLLITLILATAYGLIIGIRGIVSKNNKPKYR